MSRREFQFTDEKSNKFWAITRAGSSTTVEWGRIGTRGQSKTKDFPDESAAQQSHDKLVAEKLKEGYKEVGGATSASAPPRPPASVSLPPPASVSLPPPAKRGEGRGGETENEGIDLSPVDWSRATWRKRNPLPLPPPAPFDLRDCCARAARALVTQHGWRWDWSPCGIAPALTREEAHFWTKAILTVKNNVTAKAHALELENHRFTGKVGRGDVEHLLRQGFRFATRDLSAPLANLLSFEDLVDLAMEKPTAAKYGREFHISEAPELLLALLDRIPYLTAEERGALRARCEGKLDPAKWPTDWYDPPAAEYFVAAATGGFEKELLDLVESWPDDRYAEQEWHDRYHMPQRIVFGLGSAPLVEQQMRRLKLRLGTPELIRIWLAHTGADALDLVQDAILAQPNREGAGLLLAELDRVHLPAAAPTLLELRRSSKAPRVASEWLEKNAPHAIRGLVATAAGRGALAEAALEFLRDRKRAGDATAIEDALAAVPADVAAKVRTLVLEKEEKVYPVLATAPGWLSLAKGAKPTKAPPWLDPGKLPPLVVSGKRLPDEQVEVVLAALRSSTLAEPAPALVGLREHGDRDANDAFAWRLFELWLAEGAPAKEKWALLAIGLLGGDRSALGLAPLVRAWPGESQHQRAVTGLECLRAIGSDAALMQLNGIAQKLKFKGLKAKAQELMEAIASDRKMTRAELEDRIVPDCDLDERGQRVFDLGPRQFTFVLGPDMKPLLRDAAGKLVGDLPKPGVKDDAEKSAQAVASWKLMKKQVKEVSKIQAERLEQAMVTGRRWKTADFEALVVRHPLLTHLVRLLVLAGFDAKGKLVATFRVTEDGTYADSKDETTKLAGVEQVGIVHPLDLDEATRASWGQVQGDYQILPPFPQLGRPVFTLSKEEAKESDLASRLAGKKIAAVTLSGTLDRLGWERGVPQDAGIFYAHSKAFHFAGVTAVIAYEGIPIGGMLEWDDQAIEHVHFVQGIHGSRGYPEEKPAVALSRVDRIAVSEVLKDLATLAEKARP
jgi:predicted DNA-binding WGR domain protein